MFIQRQLTTWKCTSSQHSKWVKEIKEGTNFHSSQSWVCMHKHVHSKATYILRVHQFTTQQVGKEDKRRKFHPTKKWVCTNLFTEWELTVWECTSSQHSKWVMEVKEGMNFHSSKKPILSMHKHVHSKETYILRVHQFTTQQVGKEDKRRNEFSLNTKSNLEYAQTCSFKGNLRPGSAPVHNTASG